MYKKPRVVCLCGSTRFFDAFQAANFAETKAGRIVLTVAFDPSSPEHGERVGVTAGQKAALDTLHLHKIRLADEVLVLNVGGYVGESTAREVACAQALSKAVRWLEPEWGAEWLVANEDRIQHLVFVDRVAYPVLFSD